MLTAGWDTRALPAYDLVRANRDASLGIAEGFYEI